MLQRSDVGRHVDCNISQALEEFDPSGGPDGLHKVDHYWDSTELQWCPEWGCVLPDFYLSDFYDYSSVLDASDDDDEREELLAPITIRVTHQKEHNGEWVQLDDVSSTCSTDQSVDTSFLQINVTGTVLGESFAVWSVSQHAIALVVVGVAFPSFFI